MNVFYEHISTKTSYSELSMTASAFFTQGKLKMQGWAQNSTSSTDCLRSLWAQTMRCYKSIIFIAVHGQVNSETVIIFVHQQELQLHTKRGRPYIRSHLGRSLCQYSPCSGFVG